MYIIKNAFKCIGRSKGRNVLIGVIVLVIAVSACVGLSIRQAAEKAKSDTLEGLTVTASISFDRRSIMNKVQNSAAETEGGRFDKGQFSELMGAASSLSLEDYLKYAEADSVKEFYYSETASVNGSEDFAPVTSEESTSSSSQASPAGKGGMSGGFSSADFRITGYSGENAMTSFVDGTAAITDGAIFDENTESLDCIISEELAAFNDLSVGGTVTVTNPNNEDETYTLTVVGIYTDASANEDVLTFKGGLSSDPANNIYMSSTALEAITALSQETNKDETENALTASVTGTYVFSDSDSYYRFEEEVRTLGLDESYTVSSPDLAAYENSLTPLTTLSETAGWFLIVILVIGAIILIVLNIFNVRERKYEIGVLTAMGMSKGKVALQFLTEIFAVTLSAVIIGAAAGAVSSVPVTNALLQNQVEAQTAQTEQVEQNFGRGGKMGTAIPIENTNYITEISRAADMTVIVEMLGIAVLLTLISGAVSMLFIMRYEPLKILANRD